MYVCKYVYLYVCIYVYMYIYTYTHTTLCTHVGTPVLSRCNITHMCDKKPA